MSAPVVAGMAKSGDGDGGGGGGVGEIQDGNGREAGGVPGLERQNERFLRSVPTLWRSAPNYYHATLEVCRNLKPGFAGVSCIRENLCVLESTLIREKMLREMESECEKGSYVCVIYFSFWESWNQNSAPGFLVLVFGVLLQGNEVGRCGSPGQL